MNENEHFDEQLERYLAGELPEREREQFEAELDSTLEAQVFDADVRPILDAARALPKDLTPERELWQGVEVRLQPRAGAGASGSWQGGLRWLAAAGVVIAAAVVLYGTPEETPKTAAEDPPLQDVIDWEQDFDAAEEAYREARTALFAELDARDTPLAEDTLAVLEKNITIIDEAVREIRVAVQDDPSNPRLMQMLVATRERELDFLETLVRIPAGS